MASIWLDMSSGGFGTILAGSNVDGVGSVGILVVDLSFETELLSYRRILAVMELMVN